MRIIFLSKKNKSKPSRFCVYRRVGGLGQGEEWKILFGLSVKSPCDSRRTEDAPGGDDDDTAIFKRNAHDPVSPSKVWIMMTTRVRAVIYLVHSSNRSGVPRFFRLQGTFELDSRVKLLKVDFHHFNMSLKTTESFLLLRCKLKSNQSEIVLYNKWKKINFCILSLSINSCNRNRFRLYCCNSEIVLFVV